MEIHGKIKYGILLEPLVIETNHKHEILTFDTITELDLVPAR